MKPYIYNQEHRGHSAKVTRVNSYHSTNSAIMNYGTSSVLSVISNYRSPEIMKLSQQFKNRKESTPHLECVTRLNNIPIVESGWNYAGQLYSKLKNSNSLVQWTLGTAESSFNSILEVAAPYENSIFTAPIHILDKFVCKSLDLVEQRVPSIYLPPEMMVWQTKQYMTSTFVKPVLKRADSVKHIGNTVLASKYTEFAADKLEDALNVADKYVEKYLPDATDQEEEKTDGKQSDEGSGKAVQTIHHVDRFSRKLQRRLTKRTFEEAKALKQRSQESIHVLLYVAELVATDPKLAIEKARELWSHLSEDEPENQARPATLEQLIVMLTRESARRIVHFVNFTRATVVKLPSTISWGVNITTEQCLRLLDGLMKSTYVEAITNASKTGSKTSTKKMNVILEEFNLFANAILERLAMALAGQQEVRKPLKPEKHTPRTRNAHHPLQVTLHPPAVRSNVKAVWKNTNNSINNGAQS